jgi:tellurite resistance protein TerC
MEHGYWEWAAFLGAIFALVALDLGVFHRRDRALGTKEAAAWSAFWIALALLFGVVVWQRHGSEAGLEYVTAYTVEKSLSVDNLFVFVVVFKALAIPALRQYRVLFWGIVGALALRGALIVTGAALLARFHWVVYLFGGLLVLTGAKLLLARGGALHPEESGVFRALRRVVPATPNLDGHRFFTRADGRWLATPLLFALLLIELSDVLFAVDSIPAVFAVTRDPFIAFTSNVFAILGLRSLYFLLASVVERFTYLRPSLAFVLVFVGVKMTLADVVKVHPAVSLGVVLGILAVGVAASWKPARDPEVKKGGEAARGGHPQEV